MNSHAIRILLSASNRLYGELNRIMKANKFNYRTFGTEIENYVSAELIKIFTEAGICKSESDYHIAKDKNEFPDFTLKSKQNLAIEVKSGNHFKLLNGKWIRVKNSNNDMGTLNKWPEKLKKFGGGNIYYIFIEYSLTDKLNEINKVKISPFYHFLGINSDGYLRYREKDGNLRPKDFNVDPPIISLKQFMSLLPQTNIYRSKRIAQKHLENIPLKDRKKFIEGLKYSKSD